MRAAIIGGGIAGMSAAIALKIRGVPVRVFERQAAFLEEGAGLQISPNGSRILEALGVELSGEFYPQSVKMRNGKTGRDVFSIPMGANAVDRWGAPYLQIHRQDLHDALFRRADALGVAIERDQAIDVDRYQRLTTEYSLVVAADGVHSRIRNYLYPDQPKRYSGQTAYRALIPKSALKRGLPPSGIIWAGEKQHAVTTYVKAGDTLNFVAICDEPEWQGEGWHHDAVPSVIIERFAGWHESLGEIVQKISTLKRWALLYRDNLPSFVHNNTVLLGDAAHPMLPSFAQGAVQALEDAYILAACVEMGRLDRYDEIRLDRVARVQAASRRNLERYHMNPLSRSIFHNAAKFAGQFAPSVLYRELDWVYGYDALKAVR